MIETKIYKLAIVALALLLAHKVKCQVSTNGVFPPPERAKEVYATRAGTAIQIDGKLDEPDWEMASTISDFFKIEPTQDSLYLFKTEVKLLFDDKNLYVGAFCHDPMGKQGIRVQDLRRDFAPNENDVFAVQIDAQNTKQYAVSFQTTPYGNQSDLQNFNDRLTDRDWNTLWTVRTTRVDGGYYAEFAIPFKSLRYDKPEQGEPISWGITFSRLARREYEQTVFPAIPQAYSPYRMTYAAKLKGLEVPPPSANIQLNPYSLYQLDKKKSGATTTLDDDALKVGVDAKWVISPHSVVDLTVNTDFAQVDVDRVVNNLERFNIFFPEQRQFFLENSGIWAGSSSQYVVPFFSRKIGLQEGANAAPVPIDVGALFTHRNQKRTLAGLYVHQRDTELSAGANFGILRYLQNYGRENNMGVMLTHRLDEEKNSLSLDQNNNTTLSVDGLIRPRDEWTISYLASVSADETSDKQGISGSFYAGYRTNSMYWGWQSYVVSEHYDPAMGFVFQNNVIRHNPGGYFILRPKRAPWIRRWDPGLFIRYNHDFENPGNFQQASLYLFPIYVYFKDNSFLEYAITPTWQNINFDFAPLGLPIAYDRYYYTRQYVSYNSDRSKKISWSGKFEWGRFYNGRRSLVNGGLRYAPIPHLALSMDYEHNDLSNIGSGGADLKTDLYYADLRLALNPRVQLSAAYQYNSFNEQSVFNVRFSWEYLPRSFIYLVFNESQDKDLFPHESAQRLISKITLLKQF